MKDLEFGEGRACHLIEPFFSFIRPQKWYFEEEEEGRVRDFKGVEKVTLP